MTVIKLKDGSLLVHDPIAPTGECIRLLSELGTVAHIVLGSTALEHKFFCRAFADKFPSASLYVCPGVFNYFPPFAANLRPPGLGLFVDLIRPPSPPPACRARAPLPTRDRDAGKTPR